VPGAGDSLEFPGLGTGARSWSNRRMRAVPRLVGRAPELGELRAEWRRAVAGEFRCVLLLGDPGVGKTRIATEFLRRGRRGSIALSATAYPLGRTAAFGLWAEALESHLSGLGAEEVDALSGGFLDDLAVLVRSAAAVRGSAVGGEPPRFRLLGGVCAVVGNLARRAPVLILLDDVHLADASSWECLHYLARNLERARVLVIATGRRAELGDDRVATAAVLRLEQEGRLRRMLLGPLDPAAMSELASDAIGEHPPKRLLEWLSERAAGNPLFALGLLRALIDERGELADPALESFPESLAEQVARRLDGLDRSGVELLELLAVMGREVELHDLAAFGGLSLEQLGSALEGLLRARLVVEHEQERRLGYEIAHPLIQEAIYRRIRASRRRWLHLRVGHRLLAAERLDEAAPHFVRSATVVDVEAIDALCAAVRRAERRGAHREAVSILGALVDLIPSGHPRWLELVDAFAWSPEWVLYYRADTHAASGLRAMREIARQLEGSAPPGPRARVALRVAIFAAWGIGDLDEAERACRDAGDLFEQDGDRPSALLAQSELAWLSGLRRNYAEMAASARSVAEEAEASDERYVALQGWATLGYASWFLGRFSAAEQAFTRSRAIAREDRRLYQLTNSLTGLACSLASEGRTTEAIKLLHEARDGNPGWRDSILPEYQAFVYWFAGDLRMVVDCIREARATTLAAPPRRLAVGVAVGAVAAAECGEFEEAEQNLTAVRQAYGSTDWQYFNLYGDYAAGVLAWRRGDLEGAGALLQQAASGLWASGAWAPTAPAMLDLVEVAAQTGHVAAARAGAERLTEIARALDRDLHRGLAALAVASCAAAGGDDAAAAAHAALAAASLADVGCPFFRGRALQRLGRSLAGVDRAQAVDALDRARVIYEAAGATTRRRDVLTALDEVGGSGRRTAHAARGPGALTRREREVARLAAAGGTAREIADTLVIGERTVETHLAHVYAKLGVKSKLELIRRGPELLG
jgi:DNA-binding CsgD family transcriptional regulator